jgi:hypothetical protein
MIPPPQALRAFPPRGAPVADRRSRIRAAWIGGHFASNGGCEKVGASVADRRADPRGLD